MKQDWASGKLETVIISCWLSGTSWLIVIRPQQLNSLCLQKQGHFIFKGPHPSGCPVPCSVRAAGSWVPTWRGGRHYGSSAWGISPSLPSDGWRVLPADLQVYPPIWRAGGRLANTLGTSTVKCHYNTCHYNANASLKRSILGSQTAPTCPHDHPRVAQHMC